MFTDAFYTTIFNLVDISQSFTYQNSSLSRFLSTLREHDLRSLLIDREFPYSVLCSQKYVLFFAKRAKNVCCEEIGNDRSPRIFLTAVPHFFNAPTSGKRNPRWRTEHACPNCNKLVQFERFKARNS